MEKWQWITLILCLFGIFKEFRPSEPFVTEYLIEFHNFPKDVIVQKVYPIATYAYLATLPIVFLITDFLRYKSIIILEGIAFVATYILLIWGEGLTALKIVEVLYGIASSTEVAYYTYIYAKVDKENYKKVTSYTYTAILVGNFVAATLSQLLVSQKWMDYKQLHLLTLGSVSIAAIIACLLPSVRQSIYFYRNDANGDSNGGSQSISQGSGTNPNQSQTRISSLQTLSIQQRIKRAYIMLWMDCKRAYSNPYVLKWSVWWAIASAGFYQIISYIQPLYEEIAAYTENEIYNGAVDAVHTLLSALLAILIGHITLPWRKWGESLLCVMSLLQGALLLWISQTQTIMVAYAGYIIIRTLYQVMITVASAEVAQGISDDSYGLVFGINRFLALSFQSVLTFAVADEKGFALGERSQFVVYGVYFLCLGTLFAGVVAITLIKHFCGNDQSSSSGNGSAKADSIKGEDIGDAFAQL